MVTVDIVARTKISEGDLLAMLTLHRRSFAQVSEENFRTDLHEKDWVIHLRDDSGAIVGFSTQMLITLTRDDTVRRYLFSGDTVVAREHRRQPGLAGAFGHLMLELVRRYPQDELYWFLISKGFRTYRFLPVYFHSYWPGPDRSEGEREGLEPALRQIAEHKFGSAFDPDAGVVKMSGAKERLREEAAAMHKRRQRDPHVRFFLEANPGWLQGDELACLAPITPDNLNDGARRVISRTTPRWVD